MTFCSMLKTIFGKIQWLWALAYLFCTCFFLYQFVMILPNYFHPTLTHTEVKEVPLKNMDFPLDFKVCFRPSLLNESVLKRFGYEKMLHYVYGLIDNNASSALIGWGGNHSVKNASEVLFAAKNELLMSKAVEFFQVYPGPGSKVNMAANLQRMNWIGDCYLVNMDMVEKDNLSRIKELAMAFNESVLQKHNVTVEVKLQGQNLATHREIQDHSFYHTGDVIEPGKKSAFRVKIKKKVLLEGEPGTTCQNYPNSDFESYRECDDRYLRARVDEITPELMPVWMIENLSKVTAKPAVVPLYKLGNLDSRTHM